MATTTPRTALAAAALLALAACAHGPSPKDRRAAEIHHDLGVEALRAGRSPADALKEFDAALELDPGFADAHRGRGLVLDFGFGRADEAEREYRRAIELKTPFPEAENDLGLAATFAENIVEEVLPEHWRAQVSHVPAEDLIELVKHVVPAPCEL